MKKDTVYVDIEDDITAIINKVKASSSKVIALVPPKRSEVLQSVVNLKLLMRSAKEAKKTVVLVTAQKSLVSLAGGVGMHIAKDLHSKPAVPKGPELESEPADIIGSSEVELDPEASIGDLDDKHADKPSKKGSKDDKKSDDKKSKDDKDSKVSSSGKKLKVPNFDKFRVKVFLGVGALIILIVGWWLAFVRLPSAQIAVKAQTSRIDTNSTFTLDATVSQSDFEKLIIAAQSQELKKTVNQQFDATGEKQIGEKATGQITIQNCDTSVPITIPAGTGFSANSLTFISSADVIVPGGGFSGGSCSSPGIADVTVAAQEAGDQYNLTAGTAYAVAGQSGLVTGIGDQMAGGTTEVAKVISQEDIDGATNEINAPNENEVKNELRALFEGDVVVIDDTFSTSRGNISTTPLVGEEAEEGTATAVFTYTQLAIEKSELQRIIDEAQKEQFDESQQSVFDSGIDGAVFTIDEKENNGKMTISLSVDGFIGPKIDTAQLAEEIKGRRFSDVVETIKAVPGVTEVDVEFSPFWVFSAPGNADRINIELNVADNQLR